MKRIGQTLAVISLVGVTTLAEAGIISSMTYADDAAFSAATSAVSLTGPLPDLGNVGSTVTLNDATLSAAEIFVEQDRWSTLLPNRTAIAVSGPEHLDVAIDTGLASAFGFYFHEPTTDDVEQNGCNATCFESTFEISFYFEGALLDSESFNPANDAAIFTGITLDEVFDEVRFEETEGGIDNEFFGEMYVSRVPEPGSLLLLGGGLLGLALTRRRRA